MAEDAGCGMLQLGFQRGETKRDPVANPNGFGGFVSLVFTRQLLQHAQVVQRVHVAGNALR